MVVKEWAKVEAEGEWKNMQIQCIVPWGLGDMCGVLQCFSSTYEFHRK